MKKIILLLFLAVALSWPGRAGVFTFIDGTLFTNATVPVGGVTLQNGVVLASSTNYYNLTNQVGAQPNTNQWPCIFLAPQGTYSLTPTPAYTPASTNFTFVCSFSNTLGTAQSATFSFAASIDGVLWVSNYLTLTEPTGISYFSTNVGAINFVGLQSVGNTNPAAALTNISLKAAYKPGL